MRVLDWLHGTGVHPRRVRILAGHLSDLIAKGTRLLDVGCGDGRLDRALLERRPDLSLSGVDVLVRQETVFPVTAFDGCTLPHPSGSFDAVMMVDVLHHTVDPEVLLRESARVAKESVVIKDHLREGWGAETLLRFMDWVGNARHGVSLPYTYWTREQWHTGFLHTGLTVDEWKEDLGLYPFPFDRVFGRSLHFVARLRRERR